MGGGAWHAPGPGAAPVRYAPAVMWITEPVGVLVRLLRRLGGHEYSVR